jgi:hypothetical protein
VRTWDLGIDADGTPVTMVTSNVSGIVVAGLTNLWDTDPSRAWPLVVSGRASGDPDQRTVHRPSKTTVNAPHEPARPAGVPAASPINHPRNTSIREV